MPYEMQLFEDTLFGGEEVRFEAPAPRAIYVSAGRVAVDVSLDEGVVSTAAATAPRSGAGRSRRPLRTPVRAHSGQAFASPGGSIRPPSPVRS